MVWGREEVSLGRQARVVTLGRSAKPLLQAYPRTVSLPMSVADGKQNPGDMALLDIKRPPTQTPALGLHSRGNVPLARMYMFCGCLMSSSPMNPGFCLTFVIGMGSEMMCP